ncbi:MAG: hypothetical protein PHE56_03345 [Bacteroidales bacterium]|nr:hypothetical protein [Bacteroidales bacterium]
MTDTRIIVRHGEISKIAKIFGTSLPRVKRALRGVKTVTDYQKIRKCAIERGGVEVSEVKNNNAG